MTSWERVTGPAIRCGRCGRHLTTGDPVFVYRFDRGTRDPLRLYRCDPCAGEAPPTVASREPGEDG